jgi:arylsulfatase A-like enzyme
VVSNFVLRNGQGFEKGFDVFDSTLQQREVARENPERTASHTTDRAIELLKVHPEGRFFMWVHYQDPHGPYTAPYRLRKQFENSGSEARGRGARELKLNPMNSGQGGIPLYQQIGPHRDFDHYVNQYDAEIRFVDEQIKRLFDAMTKLRLYEDALIIFTADHGEGMGERGYYFAHGENLYSSLTQVPCILRGGGIAKGRRSDFVQHIDIVPTILEVAGIEAGERLRGRDLGATPDPDAETRSIFGAFTSLRTGFATFLIRDGLKLIHTPGPEPGEDRYELFDLRVDPGEERDVKNEPSRRVALEALSRELARIKRDDRLRIGSESLAEDSPLDPVEAKALKALGYID